MCSCVQNLQIDYDRQTEQLDKERDRAEAAEKQMAELTKQLSGAVTQVAPQTHTQTLAAPMRLQPNAFHLTLPQHTHTVNLSSATASSRNSLSRLIYGESFQSQRFRPTMLDSPAAHVQPIRCD